MAEKIGEGVIEVTADTKAAERELDKAARAAEKAAQKASKAAEKAAKDAAKAAEKAAKESAKATQASVTGVEQLAKRVGEKLGGTFGTVSGLAIEATKDVGKIVGVSDAAALALGGVGIAAAAVAVAVVGAGYAIVGLADGAVEAEARLAALGRHVDSDQALQVHEYAVATKTLGIALDEAAVAAGSGVAEDLAAIKRALAEGVDIAVRYGASLGGISDALRQIPLFGPAAGLVLDSLLDPFKASNEAQVEGAKAASAYEQALLDESAALRKLGPEQARALARAIQEQAILDDLRHAHEEQAEALAAQQAALRSSALAYQALQESEGELLGLYDEEQIKIEQIAARRAELEEQSRVEVESTKQAQEEYTAFYVDQQERIRAANAKTNEQQVEGAKQAASASLAAIANLVSAYGALLDQQLDATVDASRRRIRIAERTADKEIAAVEERFLRDGEISEAEQAVLEELTAAKSAALKAQKQEEREAVRDAFATNQQYSRAQVYFSGAQAAAALAAQLATFLGPAAIPTAAGLVGPMVAAQIATINNQKPPELPMGRTPDHTVTAVLQRDEGVVTRRGVAALGGREAVAALNRGEAPAAAAAAAPTEHRITLDPRLGRLRVVRDRTAYKRDHRR